MTTEDHALDRAGLRPKRLDPLMMFAILAAANAR